MQSFPVDLSLSCVPSSSIDALISSDREGYLRLKQTIQNREKRVSRGRRKDDFKEVLEIIKEYCIRNDESDWQRCLACGIAWTPDGILMNTDRFTRLFGKCKSSVNGSLFQIGYTQNKRSGNSSIITKAIPLLKNNPSELRRWSFRQYNPSLMRQNNSGSPVPLYQRISLDSLDYPPPRIEGSVIRHTESLNLVSPEPDYLPVFSIDSGTEPQWSGEESILTWDHNLYDHEWHRN